MSVESSIHGTHDGSFDWRTDIFMTDHYFEAVNDLYENSTSAGRDADDMTLVNSCFTGMVPIMVAPPSPKDCVVSLATVCRHGLQVPELQSDTTMPEKTMAPSTARVVTVGTPPSPLGHTAERERMDACMKNLLECLHDNETRHADLVHAVAASQGQTADNPFRDFRGADVFSTSSKISSSQ